MEFGASQQEYLNAKTTCMSLKATTEAWAMKNSISKPSNNHIEALIMLTNSIQTSEINNSDYYSAIAKGPMLDRVYTMRYRSYSAEGYIEENSSHKFIDEYDNKANSICFLGYHQNKTVGSIRSCFYDPQESLDIPIMEVFEKELKKSIGYNNSFLEPNKFVVDPSFQRKGGIRTRFLLLGTAIEEAFRRNSSHIVVAVRPEHIKFYEMFGGKLASTAKSYPHLNFETVLMICSDINRCRNFIKSKMDIIEINDSIPNYGTY
jgi:GNAT superfamily N-acetyltransferase